MERARRQASCDHQRRQMGGGLRSQRGGHQDGEGICCRDTRRWGWFYGDFGAHQASVRNRCKPRLRTAGARPTKSFFSLRPSSSTGIKARGSRRHFAHLGVCACISAPSPFQTHLTVCHFAGRRPRNRSSHPEPAHPPRPPREPRRRLRCTLSRVPAGPTRAACCLLRRPRPERALGIPGALLPEEAVRQRDRYRVELHQSAFLIPHNQSHPPASGSRRCLARFAVSSPCVAASAL